MNTETIDRRSTQTGKVITNYELGITNEDQPTAADACLRCGGAPSLAGSLCSLGLNHYWPDETLQLDRSDDFDQTRQHIHMERSVCPVPDCKEWPTDWATAEYNQPPRSVSPAISEFRIQQLEFDLRRKDELLKAAEGENILLRKRIEGFERMSRQLTEYIDRCFPPVAVEQADGYRDAA